MNLNITPAVNSIEVLQGTFDLSRPVCLQHDETLQNVADCLRGRLAEHEIGLGEAAGSTISLALGFLEPEAYSLRIEPGHIQIAGGSEAGVFYGIQSLRQLLLQAMDSGSASLPCLSIKDSPRFSWRGYMLDESRHFFGKAYVKKMLEWMAMMKLNRFHWHLTDVPAWRIEIKAYPKLTEVGSSGSWSDPEAPSAFYTQDDIREIVAYAAERHIVIVPEIDMPGHATAANRAYPEFSGGGSERCPEFTFHPGREESYTYLETILDEVMDLFPGPWLHFGGDEVHFGNEQWGTDPEVQALMREKKLPDLKAVEYYFIERMAGFIAGRGRVPIGWDEIVGSSIPAERSAVMWWRQNKVDVLETALKGGYPTVLCPRIPCYFDFVQHESHTWGRGVQGSFGTVEMLHAYPGEAELSHQGSENILGVAGNLWTERVKGEKRADFMTFPRLFALAEAAWTCDQNKDLASFNQRVQSLFPLLEAEGSAYFNYLNPTATPEVAGVDKVTGPSQLEEEIQEGES